MALWTADELRSIDVIDPQGQKLGTVESVELSLSHGTIAYIVVEPGTGDRLVPVPYESFHLTSDKRLVLDVDQGRILTAPHYIKDGEPAWSTAWVGEIERFWTTETTWQTAGGRTELSPGPID